MNEVDWARVKELFHASVALPEAERESFLRRETKDNPAIFADVSAESPCTAMELMVALIRSSRDPVGRTSRPVSRFADMCRLQGLRLKRYFKLRANPAQRLFSNLVNTHLVSRKRL